MNLGRRVKRAEQAEARQNAALGGTATLQEDPPAPFEEDFGAAFATDLRVPRDHPYEEAEVDNDITVSSDKTEDGESITTKGTIWPPGGSFQHVGMGSTQPPGGHL